MTDYQRCGLELAHEEHFLGDSDVLCDGRVEPTPAAGAGLASLFAFAEAPRPWAVGTLTADQRAELEDRLAEFVAFLNATYAVAEAEVLPPCWRAHPGLVHELAALWAEWVEATQTLGATAERALRWHQRSLAELHRRLPGLLGRGNEVCTGRAHRAAWRAGAQALLVHHPATESAGEVVDLVEHWPRLR